MLGGFCRSNSGLSRALAALALLAMAVRALVPAGYMLAPEQNGRTSIVTLCTGHGLVDVVVDHGAGKGRGVMHEKMAIYDGLTVSLGSYNWTDNARDNNWENLILLRDAAIAARCTAEFQRVWNSPAPKESKPKAAGK